MQIHYMDMENADFADVLIDAIEKDYGRSISRIPKFKQEEKYCYSISIIFTDFCLLEAEIYIVTAYPGAAPHIEIHGMYY